MLVKEGRLSEGKPTKSRRLAYRRVDDVDVDGFAIHEDGEER